MMSIALAFAGPLGELLGGEQPMIQLVGAAESGKSSIAIAAGSVWGEHNDKERKSFSESWNNTANNLEPIAAAHD
jgi:putative DNA primase/helicase